MADFHRKNYEQVAELLGKHLAQARANNSKGAANSRREPIRVERMIRDFSIMFEADNPNFNRELFEAAVDKVAESRML